MNLFHFYFSSILITLLFTQIHSQLEITDCGNGELLDLRADACKSSPCKLVKNKPYHVELDFIPKSDAENVQFKLAGSFFGMSFDIPVDNSDACGQGLITCPVKAGEKTTFIYKGHIDSDVPTISTTLKITLHSDNNDIVCAETDVEVVDEHEEL